MTIDLSQLTWEVGLLRLTAFPSPDAQIMGHDWWAEVVGESPEQRTEQPRTGELLEEGEYRNGRLALQVQPVRINWIFQALSESNQEPNRITTLGVLPDALNEFQVLMNRWFDLETSPTVSRLAFGAILIQSVGSRVQGYEILDEYLPSVSIDTQNSSDFLYQINRLRDSRARIRDLKINRLAKWSVLKSQFRQYNLGEQINVSAFPDSYACRLELDINTIQEFEGTIQSEQLSEIYDELIELGVKIAEKGDIP